MKLRDFFKIIEGSLIYMWSILFATPLHQPLNKTGKHGSPRTFLNGVGWSFDYKRLKKPELVHVPAKGRINEAYIIFASKFEGDLFFIFKKKIMCNKIANHSYYILGNV